MSDELIEDMKLVAAAGSVEFAELSDERAIDAAQAIIDYAPEVIRDDFQKACAYYLYRRMLVKATLDDDVGQMYAAQSSILGLLQ